MYISEVERFNTPPNFDYSAFDLPENTALTMRLNPHDSSGDLPNEQALHAMFKQNDAVIIEMVSTPQDITMVERVAKGSYKDYQKLRNLAESSMVEFGSWLQRVGAALYNSRTAPVIVDVPVFHPLVRRLQKTTHAVNVRTMDARDEEELLELKPLLIQEYEVYQERDQRILQNIAPKLGQLTLQKSRATAEGRQLKVLALYGASHRSLFDALLHKASLEPGHGFTVNDHPDSLKDHAKESMYAYFLRDLEIPDETMIQYYSWANIAVGIQVGRYEKSSESSEELLRIGSLLCEGKSYAESRELGERLSRQEVIIVDPKGNADASSKDKLAELVAAHGATVEDHGELLLVSLR